MEITLERLDEPEGVGIIIETPDFSLARPEFVIGRAEDCQLQITNRFVSRHHCEVIVDERDHLVRVRDLGSQNGTFVNETPVEECELKDGDKLRVGCIPFEVHIGSV
ncbi:MAG: FHA domain-containing protein [Deltaproteobacteria bacterium]